MRKNPSRFLRLQKELLELRLSNSAKFNGTIIPKKKQHGKEKMIFGKTTLTYLLANPNLEGEIHLKGVRFVTSLKSCFQRFHIMHACISFRDQIPTHFERKQNLGAMIFGDQTLIKCYSPKGDYLFQNQTLLLSDCFD